ncbi:MAG: hypothetical protein LBU95_00820 [Rikenellaceae bacterium]|jgi:predicted acetyltransferase|nr:hypothetical protein [Rikenellaceae bacterium]
MESEEGPQSLLAARLTQKANMQQLVWDNTFNTFNALKELLHEFSAELDEHLDEKLDKRVRIEYRDRGKFEAQLQVAGDVLIFTMHTNVFTFDRGHAVWTNPYVASDPDNAYCGVINIYNFLADSFKYNRGGDTGYLIGRVFVNRRMHYFVEGKRQSGVHQEEMGSAILDRGAIVGIINSAVAYALDFDLLVPPYDLVKTVNVEDLNTKFEGTKLETGKRLGYEFCIDDI